MNEIQKLADANRPAKTSAEEKNDAKGQLGASVKTRKLIFHIVIMLSLVACPAFGQLGQMDAEPEQMFMMYRSWVQNAEKQFAHQTAGLPPIMRLRASIGAMKDELAQWGDFLQQYYPQVYSARISTLERLHRGLMAVINGGGGGNPMPRTTMMKDIRSWQRGRNAARMQTFRNHQKFITESRLRSISKY